MENIKTRLVVIICSVFISCSNDKDPIKTELINNNITLIFKNVPAKWKVFRNAGGYTPARCEVSYIDDNYIPQIFIPDSKVEFDTLHFKTKRNQVEFRHTYKGLDKLSYLFKPGDTVLFTYKGKKPFAVLLNRDAKAHDINLDLLIRETLYLNDYPSLVKYINSFFFIDSTDDLLMAIENEIASAYENFHDDKINETNLIDSLYQHGLLSKENYSHIITKIVYDKKLIELYNINGGPYMSKNPVPKLIKQDFMLASEINREIGVPDGDYIFDVTNDSSLYFGYHHDILNWVNLYFFSRKVGYINSTNYIDGVATAGGSIPNYITLYDTIGESNLISRQAANVLKFKTVEKIIENFTIQEAKHAFEKFKKDVDDTSLVNFVRRKYSLPSDTASYAHALQLTSMYSKRLSYDDLIQKHKGKLIYVDFWSSNCRPCIEQFKFSKELGEKYLSDEFVQIYISIEPSEDSWRDACEKYGLKGESYLAENLFTSRQLEEMNIKYVPHYYLYDKNGELVEDFAPRPNDEKLTGLINTYL